MVTADDVLAVLGRGRLRPTPRELLDFYTVSLRDAQNMLYFVRSEGFGRDQVADAEQRVLRAIDRVYHAQEFVEKLDP